MDVGQVELIQTKLNVFSCDTWWRQFMEDFYQVMESESSQSAIHKNADGTTVRSLYVALFDVADCMKADDVKKREKLFQLIIGDELGVPNFLYLLQEIAGVFPINVKVSGIFRECMNPRNGDWKAKAVKSLLEREYLSGFLTAIAEIQAIKKKCSKKVAKETLLQTNVNLFWAFSAVAQKDPKFGPKLCSHDKTRFLHKFIRESIASLTNRLEAHHPYLKILRLMSKSSNVSKVLSRDGIMITLRKVLDTYNGPPNSVRSQIILDVIAILTKSSRMNCKRFLKAGLLIVIMRVFSYWNMMKGKALLRLSKAIFNIYGQLAGTILGKRALLNSDSLAVVRKFAENCPSDKLLDETIFKACSVISQAYGKHKLPFKILTSPAKYQIPELAEGFNTVTGYGSSSEDSEAEKNVAAGYNDGVSDKDSDVEPEDALGTTDFDAGDDSDDDSNIDIEQLLLLDRSSETSLYSSTGNDQVESKVSVSIPRFKVEKNAKSTNLIQADSSSQSTTKKNRLNGIISQESIDLFESVTRTIQTPLVKLIDFEHFFKEFDEVSDPTEAFFTTTPPPEHITKSESIVLGLLEESIPLNIIGPIPSAEHKYLWKLEHRDYVDLPDMRKKYLVVAKRVHTLIPFVKIAYPDFTMAYHRKAVEYVLGSADRYTLRNKAIAIMARSAGSIVFKPKVLYDLDALLVEVVDELTPDVTASGSKKKMAAGKSAATVKAPKKRFGNNDEQEVGKVDSKNEHLKFESRFESGNLRKVIQIGDKEYDLYLTSDVNSSTNTQWFYFQVSNVIENCPYTFNIVNCVKPSSQFNYGMQPVIFSVAEALEGKPGWVRSGINVCYHRNGLHQNAKKKSYYTVSFSLVFHRRGDICYIAYHYPYTYTRLLVELWKMIKIAKDKGRVCARYDVLCESLNKNEVPLITITGPNNPYHPIELREVIVLTSRVHPGEPNASWMMHGILHRLLLGSNLENILNHYVFKIVPMLNVEGVINGCSRNGLTGEDLNRLWKNPNAILHPSIFNAKGMIEYSIRLRNKTPILYCDLHGHSRKKNTFIYGCSRAKSWSAVDRNKKENPIAFMALPEAMARRTPTFSMTYCNYDVRKGRESTARVALWRDFGIVRSYTLECSYCGCDRGLYKGQSMGINQLIECGEALSEACEEFLSPNPNLTASHYDIPFSSISSDNDSCVNLVNFEDTRYTSQVKVSVKAKARRAARKTQRTTPAKQKGSKAKVVKRANSYVDMEANGI